MSTETTPQRPWPFCYGKATDRIVVTRGDLWQLAAKLHAPGHALWLANDDEVFTVEDVRAKLRELSNSEASGVSP